MARGHLDYLDGLRAVAILGVVLVHTSQIWAGLPDGVQAFAANGAKGVQLFFVISGFTLGMRYLGRPLDLKTFYVRRAFRVAPMFYVGILLYSVVPKLLALHFFSSDASWSSIVATALFVHGWTPATVNLVVPGGWSIAAEAMFYLSFPAFHWLLTRKVMQSPVLILLAVCLSFALGIASLLVCRTLFGEASDASSHFSYYFWVSQIPAFFMGLAMSRLSARLSVTLGRMLFAAAAFLIVIDAVFSIAHFDFGGADLLFGVLILGASVSPPRLLSHIGLARIGTISFSIYTLHFLVIYAVGVVAPATYRSGVLSFACGYIVICALSALVSAGSYRFVEMRMIKVAKRLTATGTKSPEPLV